MLQTLVSTIFWDPEEEKDLEILALQDTIHHFLIYSKDLL